MVTSRKSAGIHSSSQIDTRMSWNALKAVVPIALYSSTGIPSAPGVVSTVHSFYGDLDFIYTRRHVKVFEWRLLGRLL